MNEGRKEGRMEGKRHLPEDTEKVRVVLDQPPGSLARAANATQSLLRHGPVRHADLCVEG
jgi:hypothetical protein